MTQKERLVALINEAQIECDDNYGMTHSGQMADYLLENGVILPPCKVGDKVYVVAGAHHINVHTVVGYHVSDTKQYGKMKHRGYLVCITWGHPQAFHIKVDKLGTTVFLTREEAEAALERMKGARS